MVQHANLNVAPVTRTRLFLFAKPGSLSLAATMLVFANVVAQIGFDWLPGYVPFELVLGALMISLPWVGAFLCRELESLQPIVGAVVDARDGELDNWFDDQNDFTCRGMGILLATLSAGIVGTGIVGQFTPWFGVAEILFDILLFVTFSFIGAVAWEYFGWLIFAYRLGMFEVRGDPFDWPEQQLRRIHRAYMEAFGIGVVLYLVTVAMAWLIPGGGVWVVVGTAYGVLFVFPAAALVISFFLISEYLLHLLFERTKQQRLDKMKGLLSTKFQDWTADFQPAKAQAITDLLNWCDRIRSESDWPLDLKSVLVIVTGMLLPTVKSVFELIGR